MKESKISLQKINIIFLFIIIGIFAICKIRYGNPDNDMWWMMSSGRYILENGFPQINPFTYHENMPIVIQQWLLAIINYSIYHTFGQTGLMLFAMLLYTTNVSLLYKLTKEHSKSPVATTVAMAIGSLLLITYANTRPTQLTTIVLLIEQLFLLKYKNTGNKRILWILPVLTVVEANIHASFILFILIFAMPYLIPSSIEDIKVWQPESKIILPVLSCIPASLLNPYGIKGATYLFKSYNNQLKDLGILELQTPSLTEFFGTLTLVASCLLTTYLVKHKKNADLMKVSMLLGTILLSCMHRRNIWMLIFGLIPVVCDLIEDKGKDFFKRKEAESDFVLSLFTLAWAGLSVFMFMTFLSPPKGTEQPFPQLANYLSEKQEEEEIKVFNEFDYGGYLEWNDISVFLDERPELYSENGVLADYIKYRENNNTKIYEQLMEKYEFTHFVVGWNSPFSIYLDANPDIKRIAAEKNVILYERTNSN